MGNVVELRPADRFTWHTTMMAPPTASQTGHELRCANVLSDLMAL